MGSSCDHIPCLSLSMKICRSFSPTSFDSYDYEIWSLKIKRRLIVGLVFDGDWTKHVISMLNQSKHWKQIDLPSRIQDGYGYENTTRTHPNNGVWLGFWAHLRIDVQLGWFESSIFLNPSLSQVGCGSTQSRTRTKLKPNVPTRAQLELYILTFMQSNLSWVGFSSALTWICIMFNLFSIFFPFLLKKHIHFVDCVLG